LCPISEPFAVALGLLGYVREARELSARFSQGPDANPTLVFLIYYGLGEYETALTWLRRMIDSRPGAISRRVSPGDSRTFGYRSFPVFKSSQATLMRLPFLILSRDRTN
jgi:hypothetical protein